MFFQGYGGKCGKRPKERVHVCATILSLEPFKICQGEHEHVECPQKAA